MKFLHLTAILPANIRDPDRSANCPPARVPVRVELHIQTIRDFLKLLYDGNYL